MYRCVRLSSFLAITRIIRKIGYQRFTCFKILGMQKATMQKIQYNYDLTNYYEILKTKRKYQGQGGAVY